MQSLVERSLYILVVVLFIAVGFLLITSINANQKLNKIVTQRTEDSKKNQAQITNQLEEMKRQHEHQSAQIECLVKLFVGNQPAASDIEGCATAEVPASSQPSSSSNFYPGSSQPTSSAQPAPSGQQNSPQAQPQQPPAQQQQPTLIQRITNLIPGV